MSTLQINILGDFQLIYGAKPVKSVNTVRMQSLLVYLVLHRNTHLIRQCVAFLFWPDTIEAQARTNLRNLLHLLRRALPDADRFLDVDAQRLQWRSDAPFTLDASDFECAVAKAHEAAASGDLTLAQKALQEAVALYRGDLLPGCYDDWILPERERLHQVFLEAMERLILLLEDQRHYDGAIKYAQQLLHHDPPHEATYRRLMRLYVLNGDRAGALRIYYRCATVLQRELDVEPSQETREVYEHLLTMNGSRVPSAVPPVISIAAAPLVGRRPEWNKLLATWRTIVQGGSHFVLVAGEAGVGKTRLAEELIRWAGAQGILTTSARCYSSEGGLPYAPVVTWLRSQPLSKNLSTLDDVWLSELIRLLPELLVERPDLPHPGPLTESRQRRRLFEALSRAILASNQPLLLMLDDLQWCDRETLAWLHYLLRSDIQARLLIIGAVRSEEVEADHPLMSLILDLRRSQQLTEIELTPLNEAETISLAENIAGRQLDPTLAQRLYQETEGNPLYVVEIVRAGLHGGNRGPKMGDQNIALQAQPSTPELHFLPLPPTVQAVIEARLAQLSPEASKLVNLAATIGRGFTFDVLLRASDSDEDTLVRSLDELWHRRIVREQGADAYDFSHDKIREVAYTELSKARRRFYHHRVAQALETACTSNLDAVSPQVAVHYEQAGLAEQAIPYYRRAAEVARRVGAYEDATGHVRKGLQLLKTLPDMPERVEQEIMLQVMLGGSLIATRGYAAPEVKHTYDRAMELVRQVEKTPQLFPVLWGLGAYYHAQANFKTADESAKQLLDWAKHLQDPELLMEAHTVLGLSAFSYGSLATARSHFEQGFSIYDPGRHFSHAFTYGQDPGVACLTHLSFIRWLLGYPDQALTSSRAALNLGQKLSHSYSLGYALCFTTIVHVLRREAQAAQEWAAAVISLSTEHGIPLWLAVGHITLGWALTVQGRAGEGIDQSQHGLEAWKAAGARMWKSFHLALLAEAYQCAGHFAAAVALLDEALDSVKTTGEGFYEAELHRLRGVSLLGQADPDEHQAEACLRQACDLARRQDAKSLELRAVVSLCRLWQKQGKPEPARQMLAATYGWFSEGFDTPDLIEAKSLLEELS
jgi:DNA-binding SARP family transcriptional activator/predicted ATPase